MADSHLEQLQNLRKLFREAAPTDSKTINNYAWIIAKALLKEFHQLGSTECRTLLAEYLKLPTERPSRLHSTILYAAIKVAYTYPDFRFPTFFNMWGVENIRPEDYERQPPQGGILYPSIAELTARTFGNYYLLHTEEYDENKALSIFNSIGSDTYRIIPMLVTRIKEVVGKDGRKFTFVTLTSPKGLEIETISHNLKPSPLHPLPEGKHHRVNIAQLYNCLLRTKAPIATTTDPDASSSGSTLLGSSPSGSSPSASTLSVAHLSFHPLSKLFPTSIGYIESIDVEHSHMHIYDQYSRHFVAHVQRFSREKAGNFLRFIPITPQTSKFKTAIIITTLSETSPEVTSILRDIRIDIINKEKGYASWELIDKDNPITEQLSPLQLSQGEESPSFTSGFIPLTAIPAELPVGSVLKALIYLKRGKDRQKRPHVARIFNNYVD